MMDPQFISNLENVTKLCTALTVIITLINALIIAAHKLNAPDERRDERIADLEERVGKVEDRQIESENRIKESESSQKIMMQSLLALMRHAIDGNNTESLKKAAKDMDDYLINK